ncbi:MAG: hypothetical protein IT442_10990 [Phycisphaeraceae bacterium]|nr:hypothetical protein [Phycisphaeraceae bacterium]
MDVIRVVCPNLRCRSILSVPIATRGKVVRCRQCNTRVKIPDTLPTTPAAPPPAQEAAPGAAAPADKTAK